MTELTPEQLKRELEHAKHKLERAEALCAPYDDIKVYKRRLEEAQERYAASLAKHAAPAQDENPDLFEVRAQAAAAREKLEKAERYCAPYETIKKLKGELEALEARLDRTRRGATSRAPDLNTLVQANPRCPECNGDWTFMGNDVVCTKCSHVLSAAKS